MKPFRSSSARIQFGFFAAASVLCLTVSMAQAQPPPARGYDDTYADLIGPQPLPDLFDPGDLGMARVDDPQKLLELLTHEDRCPPRKRGTSGIPCALISYAPEKTLKESYASSLRPVFRLEGDERVWTFLDTELSLVQISNLWEVSDLHDANLPGVTYRPTAVVGYEENNANCSRRGPEKCVDPSHFKMFVEWGYLTPACLDEIWNGRRGGASGVGVQSRCRFSERD